jgi:hypothetical protein
LRGLLFLALCAIPFPAFAVLGSNVSTVYADQARMKGTLGTTNATTHVVHEIKTTSGITVREYVSNTGTVFAVAWEGRFPPNLEQLLGQYYPAIQEATKQQRQQRRGRGPVMIQLPGIVYESAGNQRSFQGRSFVPEMLPTGVQASDIR